METAKTELMTSTGTNENLICAEWKNRMMKNRTERYGLENKTIIDEYTTN
jgi:hypothetical protein